MGLRDGFERIEKDVHCSVIGKKTGAQRLMESEFGMTGKTFIADNHKLDNQQQQTHQEALRQSLGSFVGDKSQNMDQQIIQDNKSTYNIYDHMKKTEESTTQRSSLMHDIPNIKPTRPIDIKQNITTQNAVNEDNESNLSHLGIMSYG